MNTKNIYIWNLILIFALFMNSCKDDYSVDIAPGPGVTPAATFTPEEDITFTGKGGSTTINVTSNMPDSTISSAVSFATTSESWCKAVINGNKVTITSDKNTSYSPRSATVTIKAFTISKTFAVEQDGKEYEMDVTYPYTKVYKIKIPSVADFDKSKIYSVMDGNLKVAEICLEYLNCTQLSTRAIVVYGVAKRDGNSADYKNGFIAQFIDNNGKVKESSENGSVISFNYETNECSFISIKRNYPTINTVYLASTGTSVKEVEGATELEAKPYYITDKSGNSYPVVKIGSEVWQGSNMRTLKLSDGTNIPLVNSNLGTNDAVYPRQDTSLDPAIFGYLYYATYVTGDNITKMGGAVTDAHNSTWRVPTGGGSNASGIMGTATDWQRLWKYIGKDQLGAILSPGYSWSNGGDGAFNVSTVTNITGMSIPAAGEIYGTYFAWSPETQAFLFYQGGTGYSLCETDGKAADMAGVRVWPHGSDACSIRLVRADQHNLQ
jgi:hypothetical protein